MLISKSISAWDQEAYLTFQVNEDVALPLQFVVILLYSLPKKLDPEVLSQWSFGLAQQLQSCIFYFLA